MLLNQEYAAYVKRCVDAHRQPATFQTFKVLYEPERLVTNMPLSRHDAEEGTRQVEGTVLDARERFSDHPTPATAHALINRQDELIAVLKEQLRQALS